MDEIFGRVDIPGQPIVAQDTDWQVEALGFGHVSVEGRRTELEGEIGRRRRQRQHVGTPAMTVGHERHAVGFDERREIDRQGQIAVGHNDTLDSAGDLADAIRDRAVETQPGAPQHPGIVLGRKGRHILVVAHDVHVVGRGRSDDALGHGLGQRAAILWGKDVRKTLLGPPKILDRHEDCGTHRWSLTRQPLRRLDTGACQATSWRDMTIIGTLAEGALADVGPSGQIASGASGTLNWWVAADDRWHTPADEITLRQSRLEGAPVIETAIRVPSGDVVHRAFGVASGLGALIVVEIENRSPLPVAVAFDRKDLLTSRPPTTMPIEGIKLPADSIVVPIGKSSTVRVVLGRGGGSLPPGLPTADDVVRGWLRILDRSPRLVLPDDTVRLQLLADRADVVLGSLPSWSTDPAGFLLSAAEKVRCGQPAEPLVDDIVRAAIAVAKSARKVSTRWTRAALSAASDVLGLARQPLAAADVLRMLSTLGPVDGNGSVDSDASLDGPAGSVGVGAAVGPGGPVAGVGPSDSGASLDGLVAGSVAGPVGVGARGGPGAPVRPVGLGGRSVGGPAGDRSEAGDLRASHAAFRLAATRDGLAALDDGALLLLQRAVPAAWFGQPIEVHDAPVAGGSVSFAVRWHGERPALLWESTHTGAVRCLGLDPNWTGQGSRGEALLPAPAPAPAPAHAGP